MAIKKKKYQSSTFAVNSKELEYNFGLKDYYKMLIRRGACLPITYFLECHLFDLIRGTDTHTWFPKELEKDTNWSVNCKDGVFYMSSICLHGPKK